MVDLKGEMRLQKFVPVICAGVLVVFLAHCSNYNTPSNGSPTPTPTPSNPNPTKFKKRVLISLNSPTGGDIVIADGSRDVLASQTVGVNSPGKMATASGETAILSTTFSNLTTFNNPGEVVFFNTAMQALPTDVAITSDGKTAFAAIKNKGVVEAVDTATGNIVASVVNSPVATAVPQATAVQPHAGVFNGSETKAFILNCGPECGGTAAGVV